MRVILVMAAVVLAVLLILELSPDALAMGVGVVFGVLALVPAFLLAYGQSHPGSVGYRRAHLYDDRYLDAEDPVGYLEDDDDYEEVIIVQKPVRKQLIDRRYYRG
jgi:hypothetical protein